MLSNLIKYSLRSFKRQRSYIIINIMGLSIGIACSLLIAIFVLNEANYDKFNEKKDRIYRLVLNGKIRGQEIVGAFTPAIMGPTMLEEFPEVEDYLRMTGSGPTVAEYESPIDKALLAWPLIWYFAGKWLESFHYRIELGLPVFMAGFAVALAIALMTISYRIVRATRVNPAQSLKYE